jgi:hypothetical protein
MPGHNNIVSMPPQAYISNRDIMVWQLTDLWSREFEIGIGRLPPIEMHDQNLQTRKNLLFDYPREASSVDVIHNLQQ